MALLASYKVAHRIAKSKELHACSRRRTHSTCCCSYGESYDDRWVCWVSALALIKSKYRSKLNVEKEISSLNCTIWESVRRPIGSSIPQIIGCRYFAKCTFYNFTRGALGKSGFSKGAAIQKSLGTTVIEKDWRLPVDPERNRQRQIQRERELNMIMWYTWFAVWKYRPGSVATFGGSVNSDDVSFAADVGDLLTVVDVFSGQEPSPD